MSRSDVTPIPKSGKKHRNKNAPAKDPMADATPEVMERSGGYCEGQIVGVCVTVAADRHHRKLRRHGDHRACNILLLCDPCHDYTHANPAWAFEHGFLVRATDDPAEIPWDRGAMPLTSPT